MLELSAFLRPRSVEEALALLAEHGAGAKPLAGGTSLIFSKSSKVDTLVDLHGAGLDRVGYKEGTLTVGAMVTLSSLARHLEQGPGPRALLDAASKAGTQILQNQITVGGNCVQVYAWSDLPVVFLATGAAFILRGSGGERVVEAETLFAKAPIRTMEQGELLVQVRVPLEEEGCGSAYLNFTRTDSDHSLCSVAAQVALGPDGAVTEARVAAGAVRGLPQLLIQAEDVLKGKAPTPELLDEAGAQAAKAAKITADYRATAGYRQQLLGTMVADVLGLALERAGGAA